MRLTLNQRIASMWWGGGLLSIVMSFLEHNHTDVWVQDEEQGGNMVAGGYKQWEQKSFQSRFANTNDPKSDPKWESELDYFFFFLWALSSMIQCLVDRSGCEPCNNKSSFPGEVTKTIALPGVLGMQGHPHNTNLPAAHKSCRKHLSGRKQFIQYLHSQFLLRQGNL